MMNSRKPISPVPAERPLGPPGFTLIEMVISLTILALVVTVLYLAFSTAGRVWSRQRTDGGRQERESALARLLQDDFNCLVPYAFNDKKGAGFFFALGPKSIFYATTSGFGAAKRVDGGLYFACLYLAPDDDADPELSGDRPDEPEAAPGQTLYLVKEPGPKGYLLEALHEFITRAEGGGLRVGEKLRENSVAVLRGLVEPSFAIVADVEKLNPATGEPETGALVEKKRLRRFSRKSMPRLVLFSYRAGGEPRRLLLETEIPPPLPVEKKKPKSGKGKRRP